MTLDLYADQITTPAPAPMPKPATSSPKGNGWLTFALAIALAVVLLLQFRSPHVKPDGDDVKPSPSVSGLHVLVIEETADREKLPQAQISIFTSQPLRDWYTANCAKENGVTAYRCFDKDDDLKNETAVWRDLRSRVTLQPPCYLVVDGARGEQGRLPEDPERFQQLLDSFKAKHK